jgi:hypothetical protein
MTTKAGRGDPNRGEGPIHRAFTKLSLCYEKYERNEKNEEKFTLDLGI